MRLESRTAREWAYEEFGHAELGDSRRTARLVRMAARLAEQPGGKVLSVFHSNAEQQGAYDFLGNPNVRSEAMLAAVESATLERCQDEDWVHVVVDGTSLKLADHANQKDFGAIGAAQKGARGVKVIHAYAVAPNGTPVGILNQQWWTRARHKKRNDCQNRPLGDKETVHWVRAIGDATRALRLANGPRAWFQIDREGDRFWTLATLDLVKQWFTIRSTYSHRFVICDGKRRCRLGDAARKGKFRGMATIELPEKAGRAARTAQLRIRTTTVTLDMVEAHGGAELPLTVNVVDVREVRTTPRGEKPIHWRLLTNHSITSKEDVLAVIDGYTKRWRIEELHRVWKSGALRVEETQLRSSARVVKWAILAVVTAARIERLRMLARTNPNDSARVAFSDSEIEAIIIMKRRHAKRTEVIPDDIPTLAQAVRWLADLGGYAGHKSSGQPGAITLRRGLEYIGPAAQVLEALKSEGKL